MGVTKSIYHRIKALDTGCPYHIEVVWKSHMYPVRKATQLEDGIHSRLWRHRVKGEWFEVPQFEAIKEARDLERQFPS